MKNILFLIVIIVLSSCARMTVLKNPNTGDVQKCEVSVSSQLLTGAYVGGLQHDSCVNALTSAGYKKVTKNE